MPHPIALPRAGLLASLFLFSSVALAAARYDAVVFEQVDVKADIVFHTATNVKGEAEALKLDVYLPAGDTERKRAAIVIFHGGGFQLGNDRKQSYIKTIATEFAKRGYVCVSPDYRVRERRGEGAEELATVRDAVEDSRVAMTWVRAHAAEFGIDTQRIAVGGGSAGGMIAVSLVALENADAAEKKYSPIFALINLWGSPKAEFRLGKIDEHYPPTIIVHGTADKSVAFANSEALVVALKAKGIKNQLIPLPGAGHTPMGRFSEFLKPVSDFVFAALPPAGH